MADNRKYYYLKLKESYFDDDAIVLLESMPDGILYSNILLKLYLKSLKNGGKLQLDENIPYTAQMIATLTRQQVGTVERALGIFQQLGLVEQLHGGLLYMTDIELMIGQSSTEAERKRAARLANKALPPPRTNGGHLSDIRPPEIEIKKEIDIEIEKERELETGQSNRDRLCGIIDTILAEQPKDFEVFLQKLIQQGYEVKRGKHTAVKGKGQKRFIRFRTLGTGYGEDEIKAVLEGKAKHKPYQKKPPQEQSFQLLVDRRKHCLLALRTVKLPFQSSRVIFLGRSPAEEHLPGIIQAKECMKKKKHISEEQHYLCEIGLEKMPYGSSWLYKSYTEEILTHITITAYYNVGEAFLQASTAAWENLWDCRAALRKLVSSVYLESDLNLPFVKNGKFLFQLGYTPVVSDMKKIVQKTAALSFPKWALAIWDMDTATLYMVKYDRSH